MIVLLLALLVIWPIAELFVMVLVAQWIGFFWMLLLLFGSAVAGILVLRHRGRVHWERLRGAVADRRPPAREAFDGTMITTGAVLLIVPGFITSGLGLLLLFPPTRFLVRVTAFALFASRFRWVAMGTTWGGRAYGTWRGSRSGEGWDIEAEAVEVEVEAIGPGPRTGPGAPQRPEGT